MTPSAGNRPIAASPRVTAGFRWAPLTALVQYTAIVTAKAQPAVITIQPELLPLVCRKSTTFATTPSPKSTSRAVPISSAENGVMSILEEQGSPSNRPARNFL